MNGHSIALVLPYFGTLPAYFNFYLRSMSGMNFDVLFFSDLEVGRHPDNFKIVRMTFDAFKTLSAAKLGHEVRLDTPKRLCDFKPMYGKIFEDWLKGYDYWAFGDCDLVYGRTFANEVEAAVQSGCDLFTLHEHYIAGPFCLLKNTARLNELWREADNWEEVLTAQGGQCVAFDELHGDWHRQLSCGEMSIDDCRRRGDSFTAVVLRTPGLDLRMRELISESALCRDIVRMEGGRLTRNGSEIPIFHYVRSKIRKYFTYVDAPYAEAGRFIIDSAGFYVSSWQKCFRLPLNFVRKVKAAIKSLRNNGMARLSPKWQKKEYARASFQCDSWLIRDSA